MARKQKRGTSKTVLHYFSRNGVSFFGFQQNKKSKKGKKDDNFQVLLNDQSV